MNNNDNKFKVINEDGIEITCDILFTFDSEETGKSYIVYTDNTTDEFGNTQVFASIYDKTQVNPRLQPIETDVEWKIVETILNCLQEMIQAKMNGEDYDVDQAIHQGVKELFGKGELEKAEELIDEYLDDEFYDIEDDFEIPDFIDEPDFGTIQPIVVKLHIYEKHQLNHNPHAPHTKIGEVLIDGTCGTVTIGKSRVCDIAITKSYELQPVHVMLTIVNGKVMLSNLISWSKVCINELELKELNHLNESFYEINNGDYFTIEHKYKVYIEIIDPSDSKLVPCELCGKEFVQTNPDIDFCVDCRKQFEEEMSIDADCDLIKSDLSIFFDSQQQEDLQIKIINIDEQKPQIFGKMFKR